MTESRSPLRTVARAFEIIDELWKLNGAGLAELSQHTDIPKSTVHDYLRTLESTGYVIRHDDEYALGYRFLTMGGRLRNRDRFFHAARAEVEELARETGELPNIAVEEDGECVILYSMRGNQSLDLGIYPGLRTALHSHATGKALLAHLPDKYVQEMVLEDGLEQITEHTITDEDELMSELAEIREREYAFDWDQQVVGMGTIAVPILVHDDIIGSLALTCPTGRIQNEDYRKELIQKVREAANTIMVSYQYGH